MPPPPSPPQYSSPTQNRGRHGSVHLHSEEGACARARISASIKIGLGRFSLVLFRSHLLEVADEIGSR